MLAAKRRPSSRVRHSHAPPSLVSRLVTGRCDRFKSFAKELVDLRPDALLGVSRRATDALAKQTQTLPIVFAIVADPIRSGFAVSLSRPGRNITGFTEAESTLGGKWVGLLKESHRVPRAWRFCSTRRPRRRSKSICLPFKTLHRPSASR
jgi:ABC transporter substrate binding protein